MPPPVEALLRGIMNKGVLVLVRGARLQILINCPALKKTSHPGAGHMGRMSEFAGMVPSGYVKIAIENDH
jgi:hypothetical protein